MKESSSKHLDTLFERYPILSTCKTEVQNSVEAIIKCYKTGNKMLVCGNGGSAADSMHIVGELMKGFILPRTLETTLQEHLKNDFPESADYLIANLQRALPTISLVSENALSTAFANDNAPDLAFAQQVLGHGKAGDVLFAISTSGNSANVIYAAQIAKTKGLKVIGLTGIGGGKLASIVDFLIAVPVKETFKIQELHLPVYHAICLALEEEFFGN